jgi:predicted  nucleic acid-binding Zn ribbon protein
MYTFNIIIKNSNPDYKYFISDCYSYVYFLERTGQVVPRKQIVSLNGDTVAIPVVCPEENSLDVKNANKYCINTLAKIEKNSGNKIQHILIGREAESLNYKIPEKSSFYILRCGMDFPLICGDTHTEIPLYKIPRTDHNGDDYDNLFFWSKNYDRLHGLWLSSEYEVFAEEQMQDAFSSISKAGRELATLVEKLTGVPTYYFLHNYRPWSEEKDKQQKCPITGNDWLIEGAKIHDYIAFKCDESRLVSELSANSSDEDDAYKRSVFELSGKMLSFTVEAVDFRIKTNQELMNDKNTTENEYSDLANDTELLKIIRNYLNGE